MPFKSILDWLGFRKAVEAPPDTRAEFKLLYGDLLVGTLSVADGMWRFEYSDEFRKQDELRPLVEFPDVGQSYESKELWQFFVMRIPSPEQPEVEEILRREHIKEDDAVSLLKRFGEHTITNPFRLRAA
jgi:HipA-like protein